MLKINDLESIFQNIFGPNIQITETTCADDIPAWDSIRNMYLIIEIERTFKIKFQLAEFENAQNIGQLLTLINKLAKQKPNL